MIPVLFRVPDWIPLVGDQAITAFGTLLLLAFLAAGTLFVRRLRDQHPHAAGWDLVVTAAVAGIIGAKLLHILVHGVLDLPSGGWGRAGLTWYGGLAVAVPAVVWHARRQGVGAGVVAGAAAAPLALGYALGRVGSFLVGSEYGLPTELPWGLAFPRGVPPTTPANLLAEFGVRVPAGARVGDFARVHPTQLYEAAASLGIFAVLLRVGGRGSESRVGGWRLFGLWLGLSGVARVLAELVRVKRDHVAGPLTVDLLLAVAAAWVGVALWRDRKRSRPSMEVA